MTKQGNELEIISQIKRDGSGTTEVSKDYIDFMRNETESYDVSELMESYADQHLKDVLEDELNFALNKALVGKNRLKGIISSNDIAEFVNNHIKNSNGE